jgi:hypothetical protein
VTSYKWSVWSLGWHWQGHPPGDRGGESIRWLMVNGPPPPDGPWRRGSPPAPDILCWDLFISFSPPHTKSFYISTFLHLKSSWSRCFFFAKIYDIGKVPTKCRPFGRCFGVHLFEIFCENLRYFEISTNGRKYCRCRMGDHQVRVFAHLCKIPSVSRKVNTRSNVVFYKEGKGHLVVFKSAHLK